MNKGYILLYRQIEDNPFWEEKPFDRARAWVDLLMMASHVDDKTFLKGQIVEVKRGQLIRSLSTLAERWGWSISKVQRFLKLLKDEGMCLVSGEDYGQVITICKYDEFQSGRYPNSKNFQKNEYGNRYPNEQGRSTGNYERVSSGQYSDDQPDEQPDEQPGGYRTNNINTLKEEGTLTATIFSFFEERNYVSDPEAFIDYYEETGWTKKNGQPIRDWKSAAKAWERREKQYIEERKQKPSSIAPIEPPKIPDYKPEERKSEPMTEEQRRNLELIKAGIKEAR